MDIPMLHGSASQESLDTTTNLTADDFISVSTACLDKSIQGLDVAAGDLPVVAQPLEKRSPAGWTRYVGILYTIYAISMTSLGASVLGLIPHIHPITVGVYSFPIGIATSVPFVIYRSKIKKLPVIDTLLPLSQHKIIFLLMWLRSTCTALLTFCLSWMTPHNGVSDARTIYVSYVLTTNIMAFLMFKEKYGFVKFFACCTVVTGVALMTKSPFIFGYKADIEVDLNTVHLVAWSASMFCSINMLVLRYLHHIYHGVRNTFLFTWAFIATLPFAIALDKMKIPNYTNWDICGVAGYGLLLAMNNTFFAWALKHEEAGKVSMMRACEQVLGSFWRMLFLHSFLDLTSWAGLVLALTGMLYVIVRIWVDGLPADSRARKRMKWFLL